MPDLAPAFEIAATFALAGMVKGIIGLGLPTVAVGLLGLVMSPAKAAALLVGPSLVTNLWQLTAGPSIRPLLRRLWPMLVAIGVGTWGGTGLLGTDAGPWATHGLGAALILYAVLGLAAPTVRVASRVEPMLSPAIGAATGFVTAATGVFVIPAVPYLQGLGLERDELVQALGLSFTVSTLALAGALMGESGASALSAATAHALPLTLVPALVGMWSGQVLRRHIRPDLFRRGFFGGLLALGLDLGLRG